MRLPNQPLPVSAPRPPRWVTTECRSRDHHHQTQRERTRAYVTIDSCSLFTTTSHTYPTRTKYHQTPFNMNHVSSSSILKRSLLHTYRWARLTLRHHVSPPTCFNSTSPRLNLYPNHIPAVAPIRMGPSPNSPTILRHVQLARSLYALWVVIRGIWV